MSTKFERFIFVFAVGSIGLVTPACTASESDLGVGEQNESLVGAPADDQNRGFAVGVCQGPLNTDPAKGEVGACVSGTAKCSGTLIAPNLVLTARHCVRDSVGGAVAVSATPCAFTFTDADIVPGGTRITTAPSVTSGAPTWFDVERIVVPPGIRGCADDVAVLVLRKNVPRSEAFPVDVDFGSVRSMPREVAMAGRGVIDFGYELDANGDWTGGATKADRGGLLRRVAEHVPVLCTPAKQACTTLSHEVPAPRIFTLPEEWFLIGTAGAPGDSGAGVFEQRGFDAFRGRFARLRGVLSWVFIGPDGSPSNGGVVRVDLHRDLLRRVAWEAARQGRYVLPGWARDREDGD